MDTHVCNSLWFNSKCLSSPLDMQTSKENFKSKSFLPTECLNSLSHFLYFSSSIWITQVRENKKTIFVIMADGISREVQMSMAASSMFPGFRFSPTDEELLSFYLRKKLEGCEKSVQVIGEIEIYMYEPWDLPAKSVIRSDNEWFFFSPRGKKYPNGNQTRRATDSGYWKATGKERNVKSGSNIIGTKRTLVFHTGRAPKGERTEWIMHEYSMKDKSQDFLVVCRLRRNSEFRQHNSSNQASSSQRHLSSLHDGIDIVSEVGVELKEKGADIYLKKCNYSSDSQSGEHVGSTSESNQKDAVEAALVESSGHQKHCDTDDFYTEILKDDIIKLDESAPFDASNLLPLVCHRSDREKKSQHDQASALEWLPNQGTANRRIRLKKKELGNFGTKKSVKIKIRDGEHMVKKAKLLNLELSQSSLMNIRFSHGYVRVVILVLLISLALFLFTLQVFGTSKELC